MGAAKPSGDGVIAAACAEWVIDGSPPGTLTNAHELPPGIGKSGQAASYTKWATRPIRAKSRARAKSLPRRSAMLYVIQTLPEERRDMVVIQPVVDLPAVLARSDQPQLSQPPQMMRNGRLAHADRFGQGAYIHLALCQERNQPHSAGIAEGPEQFGHLAGRSLVEGGVLGTLARHFGIPEYLFRCSYPSRSLFGCQPWRFKARLAPLGVQGPPGKLQGRRGLTRRGESITICDSPNIGMECRMIDRNLYALHASICQTLAHPKRLEVIERLRQGEISVTNLAEALDISQPNLSQHLTLMRQKGIVTTRREGLNVYYRLASPKIVKACDLMREVLVEHLEAGAALARG